MQPQAGQTLELLDAQQRPLGQLTVESNTDELLAGTFAPAPAFASVEALFRAFEKAADAQALTAVDRAESAIAALGLHLRSPAAGASLAVRDVQIWSDGGMTCRLTVPSVVDLNGQLSPVQGADLAVGEVPGRP